MASAAIPLITAGIGAIGGLASGGAQYPKWYEDELKYWARRKRDQEAAAGTMFGGFIDPQTGEWIPGSRRRAELGYEDILAEPGYSPEEAAGMYYTPEEAESFMVGPEEWRMRYQPWEVAGLRYTPEAAQGLYETPEEAAARYETPEEAAARYITPEEAEAIKLTPEYRESMRMLSQAPSAGAAQKVIDVLTRASAARGGYGGGQGAAVLEAQREQGRQGAEALLRTNLGLADIDRETAQYLAEQRRREARYGGEERRVEQRYGTEQRRGTLQDIEQQRIWGTQTAAEAAQRAAREAISGDIRARQLAAGQRILSTQDIARQRLRGREFGTLGREQIAQMDQSLMAGYMGDGAPQPRVPAWQRMIGGAATGGLYGLQLGQMRKRPQGGDYQLDGRDGRYW